MNRQQTSQVTTGLLLIALGLIFLAQRLNLLPGLDLPRLWPVFLIILGLGKFLAPRDDGRHGSGAWMIFLGTLFLLHTYQILRLSDSWPLFIVAGGVSILFGRNNAQAGVIAQPRSADRGADRTDYVQGAPPAGSDINGH